ncbi:MAG: hypothetical protein IPJ65_35645 [Archangiaceae bacterium]|nr:hypothetical protein [Archangiaceae bacterium]
MPALLLMAALAVPEHEARRELGLFVGTGVLATPQGVGGPAQLGVRLQLARHFAVGFDGGYALISASPHLQDRWWLMPALAVVVPLGRLELDLGAGVGLGTSSAFGSWDAFAHDRNAWELGFYPAVRVHAVASFPLTARLEVYLRAEAAALVTGTPIGSREGDVIANFASTAWLNGGAGVLVRLF